MKSLNQVELFHLGLTQYLNKLGGKVMIVILANSVHYFATLLRYLIFARILLSWLPVGRGPITMTIFNLTEPILSPIRNLVQKSPLGGPGMMLDFSPIIALLFIQIAGNVIITFLASML